MKYLVIGDANSMHVYNFVRTVLLPRGYEVHLLTLSVLPIRALYREYYKENDVYVHSVYEKGYSNLDKRDRFHRLIQLIEKVLLMRDIPRVDICHVHSVYKTSLQIIRLFRRKYKSLILSYWGGDIEDTTKSVVKLREKCFRFADRITVTVERTQEQFQELYGHRFDQKLSICRFATEGLECIKKLSESTTREECRRKYDIPQNKVCITCGYSAYAAQHQDECMKQIGMLETVVKEHIYVLIPMQYGRFDLEYIERVRKAAQESGVSYKILEEYVPFEKSAILAIATDIYIHVRDTDAFSNALKEHIYAGSLVIKGDWLIYRELDRLEAKMITIKAFSELAEVLTELLHQYRISEKIVLFDPIYKLYSAQSVCQQWYDVIDKAMEC